MSMIAPADAATAEGVAPPKPRMTLRVGIVGHRPDRLGEHAGIEEQIGAVLMALKAGLIEIKPGLHCFADAPPEIRIVTGIAHGVDRMAARQAKACKAGEPATGPQVAWRLELISPAPIGVAAAYAWADARPASIDAYAEEWAELGRSADTLTALPCIWRRVAAGSNDLSDLPPGFADRAPFDDLKSTIIPAGCTLSYVEAAEFQLRQIDLLVAVWDGQAGAGPGGTFDIIDRGHAVGMPVIVLKLDELGLGPRFLRSRVHPEDEQDIAGWNMGGARFLLEQASALDDRMATYLNPLFEPPGSGCDEDGDGHGENGHGDDGHGGGGGHGGSNPLALTDYLEERLTGATSPATFTLFTEALSGQGSGVLRRTAGGFGRRLAHLPALFGAAIAAKTDRARQDRVHRLIKPKSDTSSHWAEADWNAFIDGHPDEGDQGNRLKHILLTRFITADRLAVDYADRYRASVILSYLFAGAAASLAILGLGIASGSTPVKILLLISELILISWIIALVRNSRRDRHHAKLVDYRALAESLRHMLFLSGIGEFPAPAKLKRPASTWVNWYLMMTAREIGLPSAKLDAAYQASLIKSVSSFEITSQIEYHTKRAAQLRTVNHELHGWGNWLFGLSFVAVAIGLIAILVKEMGLVEIDKADLKSVLMLTGTVAAIFPVIGAALTGIRFALDLETKQERHQEMAAVLKELRKQAPSLEARQRWSGTRDFLRDLEELLTRDIERFHSSYARRAITLPA
ncbi:MAG: hypothetical protein ACOYO0_05480 [Sandarakinorhabdus sp.]